MKTTLLIKLMIVLSLCLAVLFAFTACKDDEIYAGSDDFESYPDYWNDFNEDSGDIYIPDTNSNLASDNNASSNDGTTSSEVEDWTANFTEDEDEDDDVTSSKTETDTDKDGTPDSEDPDDDNDGIIDDKDPDDNNNGTPDDEEKPDYGNQGPLVYS